MQEESVQVYRSIVFGNFQQSITAIVERLTSRIRESVAWKVNEADSDWVLPGVLLSVVMFENALRWTHTQRCAGMKEEGLALYEKLRVTNSELPDVREIFVLRNAIAHGHVWEIPMAPRGLRGLAAIFMRGRQDQLWIEVVDMDSLTTRPSALNVVPSQINRHDFAAVLGTIVVALEALVGKDLLLPQALTHVSVWPVDDYARLTLRQLWQRFEDRNPERDKTPHERRVG